MTGNPYFVRSRLWTTAFRGECSTTIVVMFDTPDPDWYLDNVLYYAQPGRALKIMPDGPVEWSRWWRALADTNDELIRLVRGRGFVVKTSVLDDWGATRSRQRNEIAQGRWTPAGHGAVAPIDVRGPDATPRGIARMQRRRHAVLTAGACLYRPGAVAGARSSAITHGLPTLLVPSKPELTESGSGDGRRASHLHRARLETTETTTWFGVPVETVARTLVTLARHGRWDAIMAADAALREGLLERSEIDRALITAAGWPWVRQARAVLALADPRAESPLESITRLRLHDSDFAAPELQYWLGPDRVDFFWPRYGLVLEADGDLKYVGRAPLWEKERERPLRRCAEVRGVERVGWSDVTQTWGSYSRDLRTWFR